MRWFSEESTWNLHVRKRKKVCGCMRPRKKENIYVTVLCASQKTDRQTIQELVLAKQERGGAMIMTYSWKQGLHAPAFPREHRHRLCWKEALLDYAYVTLNT